MATEQFSARIQRAVSLDEAAFEEIRDDATLTPILAGGALIAIIAAAIGAFLWADTVQSGRPDGFFVDTVILGTIFTALLWLAGVGVMYFVLTQVFKLNAAPDAVFRVAAAGFLPYALGLLVFIPEIGWGLALLSLIAAFILTAFGLSSAFRLDLKQGLVATAAGFAVLFLIMPIIADYDNPFVTGFFVYAVGA